MLQKIIPQCRSILLKSNVRGKSMKIYAHAMESKRYFKKIRKKLGHPYLYYTLGTVVACLSQQRYEGYGKDKYNHVLTPYRLNQLWFPLFVSCFKIFPLSFECAFITTLSRNIYHYYPYPGNDYFSLFFFLYRFGDIQSNTKVANV